MDNRRDLAIMTIVTIIMVALILIYGIKVYELYY